jgi:hypothetical protein
MDNPEKLPTLGTQDSRQRQQNKTQHTMCWTPPRTRRKTKRNKNTKKKTQKKQNKTKKPTKYVLVTTIRKIAQIT